jgi:hypothetical protein
MNAAEQVASSSSPAGPRPTTPSSPPASEVSPPVSSTQHWDSSLPSIPLPPPPEQHYPEPPKLPHWEPPETPPYKPAAPPPTDERPGQKPLETWEHLIEALEGTGHYSFTTHDMLLLIVRKLEEVERATQKGQVQSDDQPEHPGDGPQRVPPKTSRSRQPKPG